MQKTYIFGDWMLWKMNQPLPLVEVTKIKLNRGVKSF